MRSWIKSLEIGIEEILLFIIIILNILDAFEILPADLDYIKKIISWSALTYMLVHARIDKVIAGQNERTAANLLISGFFLLTVKNLIAYASSAESSLFLNDFYAFLIQNATIIEYMGFILGCSLIFAGVLRLSTKGISKPSLSYALTHKTTTSLTRAILPILFFTILFFIGIFNILMEWLAIAIDAPLLMIGLVVFILHVFRQHKMSLSPTLLSKLGSYGFDVYEKIIHRLEHRKYLLPIAAGIVTLYGLTDALIYLWPAIFGVGDPLYLHATTVAHPTIWSLLSTQSLTQLLASTVIYLSNVYIVGFVLVIPFLLWKSSLTHTPLRFSKHLGIITVCTGLITLLQPVVKIQIIQSATILGFDIFFIGKTVLLDWVLFAGIIAIALELFAPRWAIQSSIITVAMTTYITYILTYLVLLVEYYISAISFSFQGSIFLLFALATIIIIAAGVFGLVQLFWHELSKQKHHFYKAHTTRNNRKK